MCFTRRTKNKASNTREPKDWVSVWHSSRCYAAAPGLATSFSPHRARWQPLASRPARHCGPMHMHMHLHSTAVAGVGHCSSRMASQHRSRGRSAKSALVIAQACPAPRPASACRSAPRPASAQHRESRTTADVLQLAGHGCDRRRLPLREQLLQFGLEIAEVAELLALCNAAGGVVVGTGRAATACDTTAPEGAVLAHHVAPSRLTVSSFCTSTCVLTTQRPSTRRAMLQRC